MLRNLIANYLIARVISEAFTVVPVTPCIDNATLQSSSLHEMRLMLVNITWSKNVFTICKVKDKYSLFS